MGWRMADFSDNNGELTPAIVRKHGPIEIVCLKAYRLSNGSSWTRRNFDRLAGDFRMAFYGADVTSTWHSFTDALAFTDPYQHPTFADLGEFFHDLSMISRWIADAHGDDAKTGDYVGEFVFPGGYPDLGQDVIWIPNYTGRSPTHRYDLHQYQAVHDPGPWGDLSKPWPGMTLDQFWAKATGRRSAGSGGEDMTPEESAKLNTIYQAVDQLGEKSEGYVYGVQQGYLNEALSTFTGPDARAGWLVGRKAALDEATIGPIKVKG